MSPQIIAIDVSENCARIVMLVAARRRAKVVKIQTVALPALIDVSARWNAIRQALPQGAETIVVAIDPRSASTRLLSFPFGDLRKVEAALEFELEGQIPYDLADVCITYAVTHKTAQRTQVLAAIMPKAPMVSHFTVLAAAGLEPRTALLPAVGLAAFLPAEGGKNAAVLSIGATQTHLAIGLGGARFIRSVRAGGDDVDKSIAKRLNLSLPDAKQLKERQGRIVQVGAKVDTGALALCAAIEVGLTALLTHLLTTFRSLPPSEAPGRVLLTGGMSRLPGLAAYLAGKLGIEVVVLDMDRTGGLPELPQEVGPEYAVALGMATSVAANGARVPLDVRHGELAYRGDKQLYRDQLPRLAAGLVAVLTLALLASTVRYETVRTQEQETDSAFCVATQKIMGQTICDPSAAVATLEKASLSDASLLPPYSSANLLDMMSKSVTDDVDVEFDELEMLVESTPPHWGRVVGKGDGDSFETTEELVVMLKRDACVRDAKVTKLHRADGSDRVEFSLEVAVFCPEGVLPGTQLQALVASLGPRRPRLPRKILPPPEPASPPSSDSAPQPADADGQTTAPDNGSIRRYQAHQRMEDSDPSAPE